MRFFEFLFNHKPTVAETILLASALLVLRDLIYLFVRKYYEMIKTDLSNALDKNKEQK